jgi:hypothetical protein
MNLSDEEKKALVYREIVYHCFDYSIEEDEEINNIAYYPLDELDDDFSGGEQLRILIALQREGRIKIEGIDDVSAYIIIKLLEPVRPRPSIFDSFVKSLPDLLLYREIASEVEQILKQNFEEKTEFYSRRNVHEDFDKQSFDRLMVTRQRDLQKMLTSFKNEATVPLQLDEKDEEILLLMTGLGMLDVDWKSATEDRLSHIGDRSLEGIVNKDRVCEYLELLLGANSKLPQNSLIEISSIIYKYVPLWKDLLIEHGVPERCFERSRYLMGHHQDNELTIYHIFLNKCLKEDDEFIVKLIEDLTTRPESIHEEYPGEFEGSLSRFLRNIGWSIREGKIIKSAEPIQEESGVPLAETDEVLEEPGEVTEKGGRTVTFDQESGSLFFHEICLVKLKKTSRAYWFISILEQNFDKFVPNDQISLFVTEKMRDIKVSDSLEYSSDVNTLCQIMKNEVKQAATKKSDKLLLDRIFETAPIKKRLSSYKLTNPR